tara:strand:- start:90 stop:611 length:522 start_codon:yes stop_codon:yes gene_type:complete
MVKTKEQKAESNKKWREANKAKLAANKKKYYEANKAKIAESKKKYYEANKDKVIAANKKYQEANKDKVKANKKIYYESNIENIKIYRQTPKAKKCHTITSWKYQGIITDDYDSIYELYMEQNHCWNCEKEFTSSQDRQLDHNHLINDCDNIRGILCRTCNTKDVFKTIQPTYS